MRNLISLELTKEHLKLTYFDPDGTAVIDTSEDELLSLYIASASEWVQEYIGIVFRDDEMIPAPVKSACLLIVGESYARREQAVTTAFNDTDAVQRLLQPYRRGLSVY